MDIAHRLAASRDLDQIFACITGHATELLGGSAAVLGLLDGDTLAIVGSHGTVEASGVRIPVDASCAGDLLARDPRRWPWSPPHSPPANAVSAPLVVGDRVIGAILVFGTDARVFTTQDEEVLQALAHQAALAIENARLLQSAARSVKHARILATAARSLAINVTPRAMYADIGRIARTSLGARGIAIYLADPVTERVEIPHSEGLGAEVVELILPTFWETVGGQVVRSGLPEFRTDIRIHVDELAMAAFTTCGVSSLAVLPLIIEGRPRGLLALRFDTRQVFDEEQRQLLQDYATHVAVALRNALLFADLERRASRLTAVANVQQAISASVSAEDVYAEVYNAVASVVDAPCFALLSYDERSGMLVPEYIIRNGLSVEPTAMGGVPLDDGATSQTFRTGEPSITARLPGGAGRTARDLPGAAGPTVALSVPILHGDRVLGVLEAESYRQDAYDWSDIDLVVLVARQAGTAITNARLFEAERTERKEAGAAALIARIALRADGVVTAADELLSVLDGTLSCNAAALAVLDRDAGMLRWVATRGSAAHLLDLPGEPAPPAPISEPQPWLDGSGVLVMLSSGGRLVGALGVRFARATTGLQRATLERLAAPIALALDTLLLREEERSRSDRQRMLATALETMQQPVFITTAAGIIQYANGAAAREYGYTPEELIGTDARVLTLEQRFAEGIEELYVHGGTWSGERTHRRKDGSGFPAMVCINAHRDCTGRTSLLVASVRNLTEERRVAEQLRQSEKLVALGELVAGVAHEVNNPLTGISAFSQLLMEESLTPDQMESARMIKREADRAVGVIRDLLAFARKTGPRVVVTNMNDLIQQTLRLRTYGLRTAGVRVETPLSPDLRPVRGDDRQLQQVLLNLIVNAEHAMAGRDRRVLLIRTHNAGNQVVIEVTDTGVGIPRDVRGRIFEPFFTTKPEGTGTGLGLSVSYGIVQTHGGSLTVESEPGVGSTFRITLPAAPDGEITAGTDRNGTEATG